MEKNELPALVRYLTLATAILTWLLILVGGIVHGTGSSLACPDWPTCYGTFFPEMKGGIFFEHSHRLIAAAVGLLTVILALLFGISKAKRGFKKAALIAVFLVIFQGVLGGITVLYRLPTLVSTAHLAVSMAFLGLMTGLAYFSWNPELKLSSGSARSLLPWILPATLLIYLQIVLGAWVRHTGAGLACLEIPLCRGSLWPVGAPLILQFHMLHRLGGIIVAFAVFGCAWQMNRVPGIPKPMQWLSYASLLLVALQIALGLWSIYSGLGLFPVIAHLGVAALLWVDFLLLDFILFRHRRTETLSAAAPLVSAPSTLQVPR